MLSTQNGKGLHVMITPPNSGDGLKAFHRSTNQIRITYTPDSGRRENKHMNPYCIRFMKDF